MSRFYLEVPKDPAENLRYRIALREKAARDKKLQKAIISACREDTLFFFNAFCYLFEPRPRPRIIPLITWPHQEPFVLALDEHLGYRDIGIEKARGEGASWMVLMKFFKEWVFHPAPIAFGLVSRNESAVDTPNDPDCLMWKLDFQLKKLPNWMRPRAQRSLSDHSLTNLDNGATIVGYSATGDVASGGRKTAFLMDELAKFPKGADREAMDSTFPVTDCRILVSTPKGSSGAYYDAMHEESSMAKIILDWKDNPTRNRGLYRLEKGEIVEIDPVNNPLPAGYREEANTRIFPKLKSRGFNLEGTTRSPWYDKQCVRPGATPQSIAQELDRDYGGSGFRYFDEELISKLKENIRAPLTRGMLAYDPEELTPRWMHNENGELHLWIRIGLDGQPPAGQYVVGCDVAAGTGGDFSSNSVACVIDKLSGEQVAEFATRHMRPDRFAEWAIALAKWFHGAYLIWESNGPPGRTFTNTVMEHHYGNIYFRTVKEQIGNKRTKKPGWHSSPGDKSELLGGVSEGGLHAAAESGALKIRSAPLLEECKQYAFENGKVAHVKSLRTQDEAAKGESHGDRVIAAGVAWLGAKDRPIERKPTHQTAPPGSYAARRLAREEEASRQRSPWVFS